MNPTLSTKIFIPDVEARVMPDGKVYIYGSMDNEGDTEFCSTSYVTYSSTDLIHWEEHGEIFNSTDKKYGLNTHLTLGAPDCLFINGKYYLYYCAYGNGMGVAVADSPVGPFKWLGPVIPADGDSIDPAIFQDDDGSVYYFWGQFNLKGGRLDKDMRTVIPETINKNLLNEHEHGFHEGASIRKFGDTYYMIYTDISRGKATALAYATAKSPLGPYEKQGVIIDNSGCDSSSWNNHGSIEAINGELYVFYHRSSQNSIYNRRLCIEKIRMNADGFIQEVAMTTNGPEEYVDLEKHILLMSHASKMRMKLPFSDLEPMQLRPVDGVEVLTYTKDGDWVKFDNLKFGEDLNEVTIEYASPKPMKIELWLDGNEKFLEQPLEGTGSWSTFKEDTIRCQPISGIRTLWLVIRQEQKSVGRLGNIKSIKFSKGETNGRN
jgi:arabinoxylan arabinofuranohydrolase